jgi:hypothetical protein
MSVFKRSIFLLILSATSSTAFGQAASSPFSTFGIGEPFGNALIQHQGMGGSGVSQPQYWSINNTNPALLVFNYYTVFQAGALIESRKISSDTLSQKGVSGNLSYLVTAFPVKPGKWTTSIGIMPFTKVNYKLSYQDQVLDNNNDVIDTVNVVEQGSGGLTQVYWANGVRLHKNWAVGLRATYLFGSINKDYSNSLTGTNQSMPYTAGIHEQTYIKDFKFSGGVSFSKDSLLGGNYRISAGAVYNFSTNLKANKTSVIQRRFDSGTPLTSDTLVTKQGQVYLPSSYVFGVSISKGVRWSAAAEFGMQRWAKFNSINPEDETLDNSWSASLGGELTPDQLAFTNYLMRITYRVGVSYEKTPFLIENPINSGKYNAMKDLGINFGLSLPTGRSSLDLAFKIGKRGNKSENILEESYYKIYFGLTFNDQWFIRRKFD